MTAAQLLVVIVGFGLIGALWLPDVMRAERKRVAHREWLYELGAVRERIEAFAESIGNALLTALRDFASAMSAFAKAVKP